MASVKIQNTNKSAFLLFLICRSARPGAPHFIASAFVQWESNTTEPKSAVDAVAARGTETILVAEDDDKLRKLSEIVLTQNGYTVILANDGQEAISKFIDNKESIQLLLLDMVMPKKGGKEVYEEIRRIRSDIKVIFSSGYTAERIDPDLLVTGNIILLTKPVSPRDLLTRVRESLDK